MALRLTPRLAAGRRIGPVFGVVVDFGPISYAQWRAAEARAGRMARERMPEAAISAMEVVLAGDRATEAERRHRDRMEGLAAEILLTSLVEEHATGWAGVEDEAGNPVPLTPDTWAALCRAYPMVAEAIMSHLSLPAGLLSAEGNASAPSPNGRSAGERESADTAPGSRPN